MSSHTPDAPSTSPPIHHWDDPDGSWWALEWDPTRGGFQAAKLTVDDHGNQIVVDVVGASASRITSVAHLAADMHRTLPEDLSRDLASDAAHHPADHISTEVAGERRMGARYRIDESDGTWWELGWDRPLGTFYAQHYALDDDGERVMTDLGNGLCEIPTVEMLGDQVGSPVPAGIAHELAADAAAFPFVAPPRVMSAHDMLVLTPQPGDGSVSAAQLAEWEASLRHWEDRLSGWAQSLYAQQGVEPRWTLPAAPVIDALKNLQAGFGDGDVATFAAGVGLDRPLVEDLLAGKVVELDVDQIVRVCEGLHCSPYDLWGTERARSVLHVYGPERWPRHIEPLDEGGEPSASQEFLRRRVEAQVADQLRVTDEPPREPSTPEPDVIDGPQVPLSATCYRREALLAREPSGVTRVVTDPSEASPHAEYHFAFRQVTESRTVSLAEPTGIGTDRSPTGWDVDPSLAAIADRFRAQPWLPSVDLVRLVGPAGESWLGWDPTSEAWEEWDDPRRHYPGPPTDVLEPASFTDPNPAPRLQLVNQITGVPGPVEFDERTELGTGPDDIEHTHDDPLRLYESGSDLDL